MMWIQEPQPCVPQDHWDGMGGNWCLSVLHGRQVWPSWVSKEEQEKCYLRGAKGPFQRNCHKENAKKKRHHCAFLCRTAQCTPHRQCTTHTHKKTSPDKCDYLGVFEPNLELRKSSILPFPTFAVLCSPTENMFFIQVVILLLQLDTLLTCLPFNNQIRTGPTYAVPASDDHGKLTLLLCAHLSNKIVDGSPYDSFDNEEQFIHPLTLPRPKSKKKAYNVYWGCSMGTYTLWCIVSIWLLCTALTKQELYRDPGKILLRDWWLLLLS